MTDFRVKDCSNSYGLAPNKAVDLKYQGVNVTSNKVAYGNGGGKTSNKKSKKIVELKFTLDKSEVNNNPKTFITWVPYDDIPCKVWVYSHIFAVPET